MIWDVKASPKTIMSSTGKHSANRFA
jgi:hypothetical protein